MSNGGGFKSLTRYYDMLAGNTTWQPWEPQGAYDALATVTVPTGGVATIDFAAIPNTYKHLEVRIIARNTVVGDQWFMQVNNDGGSNYARHELSGNGGGSAQAYASASQASICLGFENFSSNTAGMFGATILTMLDYAATNKNKTFRSLTGYDSNGGGIVGLTSGLWMNSTAAISSIKFSQGNGGVFAQNSQFTLYGVK
jgi:hypothetical protein